MYINKTVDKKNVIGNLLHLTDINDDNVIKFACDETSVFLSVMIQYLKGVKTLK